MSVVNKRLLIVQQTLFYFYQNTYYAMPHIEGTINMISNNFYKTSILTIIIKDIPPSGYVKLSSNYNVIPLFQRKLKTDKIKLFFYYLFSIPLILKLIKQNDIIQLRIPSTTSLIAGLFNLFIQKPTLPSIHGDITLILKKRDSKNISHLVFSYFIDPLIKAITKNSKLTIVMGKDMLRLVNGPYLISANFQFTLNDIYYRKDTCENALIKLLYVGSIIETKGINELISSLQSLLKLNYNVKLILIGPIISEKYKKQFSRYTNSKIIEHLGYVPWGQQLFNYYRSSDIFVFPSYSEGNPKTPMEALANSLPVVCTEPGCSNYIINEFNGIIVNTGDVQDLTLGIIKMITNKNLRQQCISNGMQTAINNTRDNIFERLSKTIQTNY